MPVTDFAKEVATEVLALDSRASLTLGLLFRRPGAVASEYVAGHRARFVPPLRLYLMASFVMFLMLSIGSGLEIGDLEVDQAPLDVPADSIGAPTATLLEGDFRARFAARMEEGMQRGSEDIGALSDRILNGLAQSMFLLLPAFAAILKLTYRDRLYVHHAIFAIYFHAFVFLLTAAVAVPNTLGLSRVSQFTDTLLLLVPIHLAFAMKRFYGESWPRTMLKWGFASALYGVLGTATLLGILVLSLLTT